MTATWPALDIGCRALLTVVLATAVTGKLGGRSPLAELATTLAGFGLPPRLAGRSAAAALVSAEAASAVLLVVSPALGYALALLLFAVFMLGIAAALRRGRRIACRCFGASTTPIRQDHLARNLILIAIAAAGAIGHALALADSSAWYLPALVGGAAGAAITQWDELVFAISGGAHRRSIR
jgi:hypothetical protein